MIERGNSGFGPARHWLPPPARDPAAASVQTIASAPLARTVAGNRA